MSEPTVMFRLHYISFFLANVAVLYTGFSSIKKINFDTDTGTDTRGETLIRI